jgi:copper chaperone
MKFQVPDMSCGHCTAAITKEIAALDPAAKVTPDLTSRTVDVETTQTDDAIAQAIKTAGYGSTQV